MFQLHTWAHLFSIREGEQRNQRQRKKDKVEEWKKTMKESESERKQDVCMGRELTHWSEETVWDKSSCKINVDLLASQLFL